jgi:integrase
VKQAKTRGELVIPVHPDLQAILDRAPSDKLTFLVTRFGKPFLERRSVIGSASNVTIADLSRCSAHGLRKAAARRLAEAGCTEHEIAAITGHASLREIVRYTKAADQKKLARAAIDKVSSPKSEQKLSNLHDGLTTRRKTKQIQGEESKRTILFR